MDGFVPPRVRERGDDETVRARTTVGIAFLACAVFAALAVIRAFSGKWSVAGVNVAQSTAMLLIPFGLRYIGRLRLLVNTAFVIAFASFIGLAIVHFGAGITMPALGLTIVPLLAVLLVGMRGGFAWLLLSASATIGLGLLGWMGLVHHRGVETLMAEHAALVVVATVLYLVGGLYEYRKDQALEHIAALEQRRHRAERDRIQALAEAKISEAERLASLGEIAAMTAHEINNPLSYVSNNLEYVERETRGGASEVAVALREARDGVQRIERIVGDLQQYGRPEQDEASIADVSRAIETARKTVEGHTRPRARVVTHVDAVPSVVASQGRLVQVLLNLLVNAAQAIPEGHADENEIAIRAHEREGRVMIEISDTGPGIPEELLGRVKDPFFTTKTGRGSGIGLALCERILGRVGGELSLENGPRGAVAKVSLFSVACDAPDERGKPSAPPLALPAQRLRILVVDDEPLVARAIRRHLSEHEVHVVTSGRDALRLLESGERFDTILCDMMMPDLTGMDVYDFLLEHHAELIDSVAFMTGGTFTERMRDFRETVKNPFLKKPIQMDELRALVARTGAIGAC